MDKKLLWVLLVLAGQSAWAQWVNYPAPGTPRTRDGKPNLAAKTPRAANGKPDLSGTWHVEPTSRQEMKRLFGDNVDQIEVPGMEVDTISKYGVNVLLDFKPEESPLRAEGLEVFKRHQAGSLPSSNCQPIGVPLDTMLSEVSKIVQTPRMMVILLENDSAFRQIYMDGRKLPQDPSPSWFGYSIGRWEGDVLVVETTGFNDKSWLDVMGHPHSDAMRLTERYRRRDFGHMEVETTIDDPKFYSRPFTVKVTHQLLADSDILEYICAENEKDDHHMKIR